MYEQDLPSDASAPHIADRRAQLVAAAEALRTWVYIQRDTWANVPVDVEPLPYNAAPVAGPVPVAPGAVAGSGLVPEPEPVADEGVRKRRPPFKWSVPPWVAQLAALLAGWSRRLAVPAALAGVLAAGGWTARAYWLKLQAPKFGTAVLETVPPGSEVFVDGAAAGSTPLTTELRAGKHVVEFRRRNAKRTIEIEVPANRSTTGRVDWTAKPTGRLRVSSEPAGAKVLVDGRLRGVTPLAVEDLAVGEHTVLIESDKGSVRRSVAIEAGEATEVSESIYSGWVHVESPIELDVTEGGRGLRLDERSETMLPPGSHTLRFANAALEFSETRKVEVKPGATTRVAVMPSASALTVTSSVPAEVFVDGERVGATPLVNVPIRLGTRDVVVRTSTGAERRFATTVTTKPVRIDVDFAQP